MIFILNEILKKLIFKYMGDVIEYYIVLFIEVFKKTLENARPARALKPGSKSGKMILKRPIQNLKTYESNKWKDYLYFIIKNVL